MSNDVFRANILMISALSFVPIADTIQGFDALCNHADNAEQVILDYYYIDISRIYLKFHVDFQ